MKKLSAKSSDKTKFTGNCAEIDFSRDGHVWLTFFIHSDRIGVEIAGICSNSTFWLNPSRKSVLSNKLFIDLYILSLDNCTVKDELIRLTTI